MAEGERPQDIGKALDNKYSNTFRLADKAYAMDKYVRSQIANNIPNTHRDIRIHLMDEMYRIAQEIYAASFTTGNVRRRHLTELKIHLTLTDMLLRQIYDLRCVKSAKLEHVAALLLEIKTITYGWAHREEAAKKS